MLHRTSWKVRLIDRRVTIFIIFVFLSPVSSPFPFIFPVLSPVSSPFSFLLSRPLPCLLSLFSHFCFFFPIHNVHVPSLLWQNPLSSFPFNLIIFLSTEVEEEDLVDVASDNRRDKADAKPPVAVIVHTGIFSCNLIPNRILPSLIWIIATSLSVLVDIITLSFYPHPFIEHYWDQLFSRPPSSSHPSFSLLLFPISSCLILSLSYILSLSLFLLSLFLSSLSLFSHTLSHTLSISLSLSYFLSLWLNVNFNLCFSSLSYPNE